MYFVNWYSKFGLKGVVGKKIYLEVLIEVLIYLEIKSFLNIVKKYLKNQTILLIFYIN